jgi:hypothetical protein
MKALFLLMFVSLSCNALSPAKKDVPVKKSEVKTTETKPVHPALKKVEEDCDDKAKKPIEIKPETISLSGNTGCSLPE